MRTVTSILLLFVLLAGYGYVGIYMLQKIHIKHAIQSRISSAEYLEGITVLRFKTTDLHGAAEIIWEDESEFSWEGKKYDVIKLEAHDDSTWCYCLCDENEARLENHFLEITGQRRTHHPSTDWCLKRLLSGSFLLGVHHHSMIYKPDLASNYTAAVAPGEHLLHLNEIPYPPPRS